MSPYITECPYCGHRLRRRAPKLPRAHAGPRRGGSRLGSVFGRRSPSARRAPVSAPRYSDRWLTLRPYATIAIVGASAGLWIATHARPQLLLELELAGPLHGEWWRLLSYQLVYSNGPFAVAVLVATGLFGWLLERRHGPAVVVALFLAAGVAGGLVSLAVYSFPIVAGGNAGALALLAAWAVPDLRAARSGAYYEGDLIGAGVIAALLLALPFAVYWAGWLAGLSGAVVGLLVGSGLARMAQAEP